VGEGLIVASPLPGFFLTELEKGKWQKRKNQKGYSEKERGLNFLGFLPGIR